jgi:lysophospholipase L1-like esterase
MSARVVAFLGSSSTAAHGLYDWIGDVARRPGNTSWTFRRFASGGDLAFNGLRRCDAISALQPDAIVILLGGNDVLAHVFPKVARVLGGWKRLPRAPSAGWYRENMRAIVRTLARGTLARIALCSIQPIGEDPNSANAVQSEINRCVGEYNSILRDVASSEGAAYLPLYERLQEILVGTPGPAFTRFDFLPFYRDLFRQVVLGARSDEIGARHGWRLHRDGIHLNSTSGRILADLVDGFLHAEAASG